MIAVLAGVGKLWAWIAHHAGPMALAGGLVLVGYQHYEIGTLNRENARLKAAYQNALENPRIIETVKNIPVDRPVPFQVSVPGETKVVTITVEKTVPVPGETRIVTVASPVLCATVAECKKIFGAAEQTITAQMHLRAGTVVPVLVDGKPVNLPLAANYPMHMTLVMDTRGVFSGVGEPDNPTQPDDVSTSTHIVTPVPPAPLKRWDVALGGGLSSTVQSVVRGEVRYSFLGPFFLQGDLVYPLSTGPLPVYGDVWVGAHLSF